MKKIISILIAVLVIGCIGVEAKTTKKSGKKKTGPSSKNSVIAEIVIEDDEPPLRLMANGTVANLSKGQYYLKDNIYYILGILYHWGYTLGIIKDNNYYLTVFDDPDFWEYMDSQIGSALIKKLVDSNLIFYNPENDNFSYITSDDVKTININIDDIPKYKVRWFN